MAGPSVGIDCAGERLELLSERAVWWPAQGSLLVADVHIGKARSFRRLGVPVPRGTTETTLQRLSALLAARPVRRLILLGDFLHSAHAQATPTLDALARWRNQHAAVAMTLVRGNHDARAGDPPASLSIEVVDEPLRLGALALCHHPQTLPGAYVIAGHWHPCVHLNGRAGDRLRLPCFWFGDEQARPVGVLPAFGAFTGMHPIERTDGDRIWVLSGDAVAAFPARAASAPQAASPSAAADDSAAPYTRAP